MIVTAWNNGDKNPSGAGYGVKIKEGDRDRYFSPEVHTIFLTLEGEEPPIEINTNKKSIWFGSCRELISSKIGKWFFRNGLAPWDKGNPPKLVLEQIHENQYYLYYDIVN